MATTARRAYTAEYSYNYVPERQPERIRRTRQRPESQPEKKQSSKRNQSVESAVLRTLIMAAVAIGILLIGIVIVNATAANLQYSINQLDRQNSIMQNEIDMMALKIEGNTSISQLETHATEELAMHYPQGSECIHLSTIDMSGESLSSIIKQKAYE